MKEEEYELFLQFKESQKSLKERETEVLLQLENQQKEILLK